MLGIVAVLTVAHLVKLRQPDPDPGTTTGVAMLLMFAVGALLVVGPMAVAVAVGAGVAVLLQFKGELHHVARRLGEVQFRGQHCGHHGFDPTRVELVGLDDQYGTTEPGLGPARRVARGQRSAARGSRRQASRSGRWRGAPRGKS